MRDDLVGISYRYGWVVVAEYCWLRLDMFDVRRLMDLFRFFGGWCLVDALPEVCWEWEHLGDRGVRSGVMEFAFPSHGRPKLMIG